MQTLMEQYARAILVAIPMTLLFLILGAWSKKEIYAVAAGETEEVEEVSEESTPFSDWVNGVDSLHITATDKVIYVGESVDEENLVLINNTPYASCKNHMHLTFAEICYLGTNGDEEEEACFTRTDGEISFEKVGIYRIRVVVYEEEGSLADAFCYLHVARKGALRDWKN